jgi:hypothetical protein
MEDDYLQKYGWTKEEIEADPDFFTPETLEIIALQLEKEREEEERDDEYRNRFMDIESEFGGKYSYVEGVKIRIADHEGSSRNDEASGDGESTKLSFIIRHPDNVHKRSFHGDYEMSREYDISRMDTDEAIQFIYNKVAEYKTNHPEEFEEELDESIRTGGIMKEESDAFPYNDEDISFRSVGENALRSENGHRMFADVLKNRLVKKGISIEDVEKTFAPDFSKKFLPWFFENYGEEIEKMAVAACEFYLSDSPEFDDFESDYGEFDDDIEDEEEIDIDTEGDYSSFFTEDSLRKAARRASGLDEAMYFDDKTGTFIEDDSPSKDELEDMKETDDIEDYPTLEDLWSLENEFLEVAKIVREEVSSQNNFMMDVDDVNVDMPMGSTMERLNNIASEAILSILVNNQIKARLVKRGSLIYPVATLSDGSRYAVVTSYDEEPEVSVLEWRS